MRTFTDPLKQTHTLDLDQMLVDGLPCLSVQATGQYVQFETSQGVAITCELGQFWREIAGPDLSAQEAGLLLADCLVRQLVFQRMSAHVHEAMGLLTRVMALPAEVPSSAWLTTRLDPLAHQAMSAYDGSEAMTEMLARILKQDAATIHQWARQLGLERAVPIAKVTVPLPALETPAEADPKKQFQWTPERLQQLEQALKTCSGSTVVERARQVAEQCHWPVEKVRSKLYEIQRPRHTDQSAVRESDGSGAEDKEGDQRACELATVS